MTTDKFFRKSDWIACWVTFIISLIVYTLTLQPTLGLEDSGELIVASDYLGVPHPPGYPIWSLLTWFFQWVLHGVTFHGHPNPAWGVNFFSAFTGQALPKYQNVREVPKVMMTGMVILVIIIVFFGLFPGLIRNWLTDPAANALINQGIYINGIIP